MCDCPSTPPPDSSAGNALCPNRPPPRVAHCVVGAARTFATDQAALSLRHHLVEDFGGRGLTSSAPDVFFHMKLVDDVPKSQKEWAFKQLSVRGGAVCRQACRFAPRAVTLLNASHSGPAAAGRCLRSGFFAKPENRARAVSQWHGFAACLDMVEAREAAAGSTYDVVVLARPDLVWYRGVGPHCAHDLTRTTIHRGKPGWNSRLEWLLLMPRAQAAAILRTAHLFESCTPQQPRCCAISRSEDLLEYALHSAGPYDELPFGIDILRHASEVHLTLTPNPNPNSNPNPNPNPSPSPSPNPDQVADEASARPMIPAYLAITITG